MSHVEPGDWFQSKGNPSAFLEVLAVWTEAGEEQVKVRVGKEERTCSKRYLVNTWARLEGDA